MSQAVQQNKLSRLCQGKEVPTGDYVQAKVSKVLATHMQRLRERTELHKAGFVVLHSSLANVKFQRAVTNPLRAAVTATSAQGLHSHTHPDKEEEEEAFLQPVDCLLDI